MKKSNPELFSKNGSRKISVSCSRDSSRDINDLCCHYSNCASYLPLQYAREILAFQLYLMWVTFWSRLLSISQGKCESCYQPLKLTLESEISAEWPISINLTRSNIIFFLVWSHTIRSHSICFPGSHWHKLSKSCNSFGVHHTSLWIILCTSSFGVCGLESG